MTMLAQIPRHQLDERARKMTTPVSSDDRGMRQLALLRSGQPVAELMLQGSQAPIEAVQYLASEAKDRRSFVKFLVGDPGAGKSAIKQLLALEAAKIEDVIPVEYTLPSTSTFNLKVFVKCLFLGDTLIRKAREKCLAIGYDAVSEQLNNNYNNSGFHPIFRHIASPSTQYNHSQFISAISDWMLDGRKSLIRSVIGSETNNSIHIGDSKYNQELLDVISDCINFYAMIGIYPIWIIEEFESIASMRNGETGKMRVLTWMRDIVDCVIREKNRFDNTPFGSGLIVLTTSHGMEYVNQHPALADRIRGSKYFTHPNPVWEVKEFCKWDPMAIRCAIFSMYSNSAKHLNSTAIAVVNTYYKLELDERVKVDTYIDTVLCDTHVEPRIKIKEVVTNIFDVMSNESQWNARKIEIFSTLTPPTPIAAVPAPMNSWPDDVGDFSFLEKPTPGQNDIQPTVHKPEELTSEVKPLHSPTIGGALTRFLKEIFGSNEAPSPIKTDTAPSVDPSTTSFGDPFLFLYDANPDEKVPELTDKEYMRKPLRRIQASTEDICKSISDKCDLRNVSALGAKYAAMRDQGADGTPVIEKLIIQFLKRNQPNQAASTWSICKMDIGIIFRSAANGDMYQCIEMVRESSLKPPAPDKSNNAIPETSGKIEKLKLVDFNPVSSIGMMRAFTYIFCMRNGFIPAPQAIDKFILDQVKEIFGISPLPARDGIAFYTPHLFGIVKKTFILDKNLFLGESAPEEESATD